MQSMPLNAQTQINSSESCTLHYLAKLPAHPGRSDEVLGVAIVAQPLVQGRLVGSHDDEACTYVITNCPLLGCADELDDVSG
jgi:hypothetical protein